MLVWAKVSDKQEGKEKKFLWYLKSNFSQMEWEKGFIV